MNIVIKNNWDYTLYEVKNQYLLEVICGRVGLFTIKIWLTEEEKINFLKRGNQYIDSLAKSIQKFPESYYSRNIKEIP
jgi:hypothetical protein